MEEEVLYPAAILVADYLKLKLEIATAPVLLDFSCAGPRTEHHRPWDLSYPCE
jgi:hypothetical protein